MDEKDKNSPPHLLTSEQLSKIEKMHHNGISNEHRSGIGFKVHTRLFIGLSIVTLIILAVLFSFMATNMMR